MKYRTTKGVGYRIPKNLWIFDFKDKFQSISLGSMPERAPELFNDTEAEPCEPTPLRRSVLSGKKKIDLVKIGNYWYQEKFITKIGKIVSRIKTCFLYVIQITLK